MMERPSSSLIFSPFHLFSLADGRPEASGSLQETGQLETNKFGLGRDEEVIDAELYGAMEALAICLERAEERDRRRRG